MKKEHLSVLVVVAVFGFIVCGCASVKILTPEAIETDITGVEYLANCQFFISKDVTLRFLSDNRQTGINEATGVVEAQRTITRRTITIASSTPGILQTKNNAGEVLDGYFFHDREDGRNDLRLFILFDEDDDNSIRFVALYDIADDKFELISNEVDYGGVTYTVTYDGDEMPYLKYKIVERTKEQNEKRKAKGRRVGT